MAGRRVGAAPTAARASAASEGEASSGDTAARAARAGEAESAQGRADTVSEAPGAHGGGVSEHLDHLLLPEGNRAAPGPVVAALVVDAPVAAAGDSGDDGCGVSSRFAGRSSRANKQESAAVRRSRGDSSSPRTPTRSTRRTPTACCRPGRRGGAQRPPQRTASALPRSPRAEALVSSSSSGHAGDPADSRRRRLAGWARRPRAHRGRGRRAGAGRRGCRTASGSQSTASGCSPTGPSAQPEASAAG